MCVSVYFIDTESVKFEIHTAGAIFSGYFLSSGCLQLLPQSRRLFSGQKIRPPPNVGLLSLKHPQATVDETRMSIPWILLPLGEDSPGEVLCHPRAPGGLGPVPQQKSALYLLQP